MMSHKIEMNLLSICVAQVDELLAAGVNITIYSGQVSHTDTFCI